MVTQGHRKALDSSQASCLQLLSTHKILERTLRSNVFPVFPRFCNWLLNLQKLNLATVSPPTMRQDQTDVNH